MSEELKIELDLRPNGSQEIFKSLPAIQEWLDVEKNFWQWPDLENLKNRDSVAHHVVKINNIRLSEIQQHINTIRDAGNPSIKNEHIQQFKRSVEHLYKNWLLIHSSTPKAKLIRTCLDDNPIHAAHILGYSTSNELQYNNKQSFAGAVRSILFDFGISGVTKGELQSLEELREKWQNNLNSCKKELGSTLTAYGDDLRKLKEQKENQSESFSDLCAKAKKEQNDALSHTKTECDNLIELYKSELGLQAPIQYWKAKSTRHMWFVIGFTFITLLTFILVALWLSHELKIFLGEDSISTVKLWKLSTLATLAVFGVWILRVLVRLLLSNYHLMTEAEERKTMLLCYLALKQEDMLPKDGKSLNLILQALFRPTSTGIVKDDAAPPFLAGWIKQATGND